MKAYLQLLRAVLDVPRVPRSPSPAPDWCGAYLDPETGLSARLEPATDGQIRLRYGHGQERLDMRDDGSAGSDAVTLRHTASGLRMDRPAENVVTMLHQLAPPAGQNIAGRYHCRELDAWLTVENAGGTLYGGFSGFLGQGRMEALEPVAEEIWALPCPRALDHTPPGDWTLRRLPDGSLEVGCWLARQLRYERAEAGDGAPGDQAAHVRTAGIA